MLLQPYAYAGNNPVSNVDPSGQRYARASGSQTKKAAARQAKTRVQGRKGTPPKHPQTKQSKPRLQLHSVAVGKVSFNLHLSLLPNWWDWGDFAKATLLMVGAIAAIVAAVLLWGTAAADPMNALLGVAAFVNGLDLFVHAIITIAKDACASCGFTRVMEALGIILDALAILVDVSTVILLTTPLEFGAAVAPLLANPVVWLTLATVAGIDFVAVLDDFKELVKG